MDLSEQLCCGVCGRRAVKSVSSYLEDARLLGCGAAVPPLAPLARLPRLAPGAGLVSRERRAAHCKVNACEGSGGGGGQGGIWTHSRSPSHTPGDFPETRNSPLPTLPSPTSLYP